MGSRHLLRHSLMTNCVLSGSLLAALCAFPLSAASAQNTSIPPAPPLVNSAPSSTTTAQDQGTSPQAGAATSTSASEDSGEIVVTARRRNESLQEVPIAVSAIGGEAITSAGLTKASELQTLVPNLTINGAFGNNNPQIFIRGVGNNDYNDNAGAAVGVYADDVYLSAPAGKLVQMFDLESVQVLRGPQGTLFGKNNTAGAILLTSKRPDGTLNGYARSSAGNYGFSNFEGAISFPLTDDLSGRLSVQKNSRNGYAENRDANNNFVQKLGAVDEIAARLLLRLRTGPLDAVLNANFSRARDDRLPGKSTGLGPNGANGAGFIDPEPNNERVNYANFKELENVDTRGVFLNANVDLGGARLTSVTAYYYAERDVTLDTDKSPANLLHIRRNPKSNQYSQELRIASEGDRFIDYVVGGYFLHEDLNVSTLFAFGGPREPFYPQDYTSDTTTYAVFGEAIVHATDRLSITGGIRYTDDKRNFDITVGPGGNAIPFTKFERTSKVFSWRGIVDYKLAPNNILYASVSRGFQGGGFNGGAFSLAEVGNGFGPEFVTAYEGGVKTSFFGGRLTADVAGFYYDYKRPQVFTLNGGQAGNSAVGIVQSIVNARGATLYGGELEIKGRVTPTFLVNGSVGLLHSEYKDLILAGPNSTIVSGDGNRLASAPDFNLVLGATKTVPTSVGDFSLHGDLNHQSRRYFDITERRAISDGPYTIVNARLAWTNNRNNIEVAAWVKNLTDQTYKTFNADLSTYGYNENFYNLPRMYGLDATFRF